MSHRRITTIGVTAAALSASALLTGCSGGTNSATTSGTAVPALAGSQAPRPRLRPGHAVHAGEDGAWRRLRRPGLRERGDLHRLLEHGARRQRQQRVPAIDRVTLSGTTATVTPVLMGSAPATDVVAKSTTKLNLADPDSLTVDPKGNLVLVAQADKSIVSVTNPGTPGQGVTTTPIGTQVDDTIWTTATSGRTFVIDGTTKAVYTLSWSGVTASPPA